MKLWEALKALDENPKKRFTSKFGSMSAEIFMDDFSVNFMHEDTLELSLDTSRDWQEVKQPVPWQEAIEAWADGKKIRCKCEGGETFFRPSNVSSACFTSKLITHGTWYIED